MAAIHCPITDKKAAHPGLLLEKWHAEWPLPEEKEFVRNALRQVTETRGDARLLEQYGQRRRAMLAALGAVRWTRKTSAALALHVAASGSFENAGLCLHPVYGFAYLPGTGLKGMARAYATTVARADHTEIRSVFGPEKIEAPQDAEVGGVVFHEAWPMRWPALQVDIVNNHHRAYYSGTGDADPAEDWESPNPVNFLTVRRGAEFEFALSARKRIDPEGHRLVDLAKAWLDGALEWLGAGAKTNAGYGRFSTGTPIPRQGSREVFEGTLTLVSPAFLAGALQSADECTLRAATLRGLLRWWWRTLHVGYLPVGELRKLEGRLWGTTERAAEIAVEVFRIGTPQPYAWNVPPLRDGAKPGRAYLAYGMEASKGKNPRFVLDPGAQWRVRLIATSTEARQQAVAALWLLTAFGGVGAKARRGFGSLDCADLEATYPGGIAKVLAVFQQSARAVTPDRQEFREAWLQSPTLQNIARPMIPLEAQSAFEALDKLGAAYRAFNHSKKHEKGKLALGLPRNIHRTPNQTKLNHPVGRYDRHASPLHFRLVRLPSGKYAVRLIAFPSKHLADAAPNERLAASRAFLRECIDFLKQELSRK